MVILPIPMLFFARYLASNSPEVAPRLVAGSIVFSAGLNVVEGLALQLTQDRFTYRLKLIRACPMEPSAYMVAILLAGSGRALVNAFLFLGLSSLLRLHA